MSDTVQRMKPALLVIDIQNAYLNMMQDSHKDRAMDFIAGLISYFEKNDFPIISVYHEDIKYGYGPKKGTEGFEFPKRITIAHENRVVKNYGDAFNKTNLNELLRTKGCNTLFLCGLSATGCVLHTFVGAQNNDFTAFLVKDALISDDHEHTKWIENIYNSIGWEALSTMIRYSC